jgi:M6 family metalloprotease-like protein
MGSRHSGRILPLVFIGVMALSGHALIVHEGSIVPEWPVDSSNQALEKRASGSASFYPRPGGTHWGVTLLVDFSDQSPAFPLSDIDDWLNQKGFAKSGCNGSVRDYFLDISNGKFDFRNEVYGFYRARNPKSYYDGGTGYQRAGELIAEIFAHFDPLVDFSKFDNDGDGVTEAVSIVYAGVGKTWGQGLWPHAGTVNRKLDGVTVGRYMMSDLGTQFSLYVFAHECGHMIFGWPDLYWFGDYCLMGNRIQDKNPVPVNDFYRADQGWIPAVEIARGENAYHRAVAGQSGFRYRNPAKPSELFFWSNVRNTGRWSALRGRGLLLYHFDMARRGNSSATNRSLYVVEADGGDDMAAAQWPSPGSAAADFFPAGGRVEFSSTASAFSKWHDGSASGLRIHAIGPAADTLDFAVGTGIPVSSVPRRRPSVRAAPPTEGPWIDLKGAVRPRWIPRAVVAPGVGR